MKYIITFTLALASAHAGAQSLTKVVGDARSEMSRLNDEYISKSAARDLETGLWDSKLEIAGAYEAKKLQLDKCKDSACLNRIYDLLLTELSNLSFSQGMTNDDLNYCYRSNITREKCEQMNLSTRVSISQKMKEWGASCSKPGWFGLGANQVDLDCIVPLKKEMTQKLEDHFRFMVQNYVLGSQHEGSFKCLKMLFDQKDMEKGLTPSDVVNRKKAVNCAFSLEKNNFRLNSLLCNGDGSDFSDDFKATQDKTLTGRRANEIESARSLVLHGPYTDCSGIVR